MKFLAWMPILLSLAAGACSGFNHGELIRRIPPQTVPPPQGWLAPPVGIECPIVPPALEALPSLPATLPSPPAPPSEDAVQGHPLELAEVMASVERHYPLLLAIYEEQNIAAGQRLAAEGAFDLNLRSRAFSRGGSYDNNNFDFGLDQATPLHGTSLFAGYRLGEGDYPVYSGGFKTADGGEFRMGVVVPLLRDRPIDRRRATLRQAQITESLAEPVIQRSRIDFFRNAMKSYWNWVAAGQQYGVAANLLEIARARQTALEEQFRRELIAEFVVIDNRRIIFERQGLLIAAERRLQQASFELSLYLRDGVGDPVVPPARRLPQDLVADPSLPPVAERLDAAVANALARRPELARFRLLKERAAVELQLAENQTYPALNLALSGAQDVGKPSPGLDRATAEAALQLEVPLQRRDAQGRFIAARAQIDQLAAQERFARDQIVAEVQDAVSNLDRTRDRIAQARDEQQIAKRVAELELQRFQAGASNLLEVNLRELAAASAQAKVVDALAEYYRAMADYRAALGLDAAAAPITHEPTPAPASNP